jgi:hypothetical protein
MNTGKLGGSNNLLTMKESAAYLRRSYKNYAANYRRWGIPAHRIQSRVYFRVRDLEAFLDNVREVTR